MRLQPIIVDAAECWLWTGKVNGSGYAFIHRGSRSIGVHKFVYESMVGLVAPGLTLDHLCRNKRCYNYAHLEPVTYRENMRRARAYVECKNGHPFTPENTAVYAGQRKCITCSRQRARERYRRLAANPHSS